MLAHHLLFVFNRLGVSAQHQRLLASVASHVVFHEQTGDQAAPLAVVARLPSAQ